MNKKIFSLLVIMLMVLSAVPVMADSIASPGDRAEGMAELVDDVLISTTLGPGETQVFPLGDAGIGLDPYEPGDFAFGFGVGQTVTSDVQIELNDGYFTTEHGDINNPADFSSVTFEPDTVLNVDGGFSSGINIGDAILITLTNNGPLPVDMNMLVIADESKGEWLPVNNNADVDLSMNDVNDPGDAIYLSPNPTTGKNFGFFGAVNEVNGDMVFHLDEIFGGYIDIDVNGDGVADVRQTPNEVIINNDLDSSDFEIQCTSGENIINSGIEIFNTPLKEPVTVTCAQSTNPWSGAKFTEVKVEKNAFWVHVDDPNNHPLVWYTPEEWERLVNWWNSAPHPNAGNWWWGLSEEEMKLDWDGDGKSNIDEANAGTDPHDGDSDGDGIGDGQENRDGTDPTDPTNAGSGGFTTYPHVEDDADGNPYWQFPTWGDKFPPQHINVYEEGGNGIVIFTGPLHPVAIINGQVWEDKSKVINLNFGSNWIGRRSPQSQCNIDEDLDGQLDGCVYEVTVSKTGGDSYTKQFTVFDGEPIDVKMGEDFDLAYGDNYDLTLELIDSPSTLVDDISFGYPNVFYWEGDTLITDLSGINNGGADVLVGTVTMEDTIPENELKTLVIKFSDLSTPQPNDGALVIKLVRGATTYDCFTADAIEVNSLLGDYENFDFYCANSNGIQDGDVVELYLANSGVTPVTTDGTFYIISQSYKKMVFYDTKIDIEEGDVLNYGPVDVPCDFGVKEFGSVELGSVMEFGAGCRDYTGLNCVGTLDATFCDGETEYTASCSYDIANNKHIDGSLANCGQEVILVGGPCANSQATGTLTNSRGFLVFGSVPWNAYVTCNAVPDADGDGYAADVDCDDNNEFVYPGAPEFCNNIDDNCDGVIDEGFDVDGDGFTICDIPVPDCDDNNEFVYPGAIEVCNGYDDDCDGLIDEGVKKIFYADGDGDGFGDASSYVEACTAPAGYVENAGDCDDLNSAVNPNAVEICNEIDDNCDGNIDEGVKLTFYADNDGDGYGDAAVSTEACTAPTGYVADATDCNDNNIDVNPGATEICNGFDDNCNGEVDENNVCGTTSYYCDFDEDFYISSVPSGSCDWYDCTPMGCVEAQGNDCNDFDEFINPGVAEVCDGIDNNCNGQIDEGVKITFYQDADGDLYGNLLITIEACTQPTGYVLDSTDCDDTDANIYPGATEVCNGYDDNCDGNIDEGVTTTFSQDADGDGYGNNEVTVEACTAPPGFVFKETNGDCNDGDASINPGATEVCNGIDDNCNTLIDEGGVCSETNYYCDIDGDTYLSAIPSGSCDWYMCVPAGCTDVQGDDCNDNNININPGATEVCNGIDDNCNGEVDEGVKTIFYRDVDNDGYGNPIETIEACSQPTGYVGNGADCNDGDAAINPGASEICNGVDDNCNGEIDEGVKLTFYQDNDGDTYGNAAVSTEACTAPTGYVADNTDCVDDNANINPGANEVCNGLDDDCDGLIDEDGVCPETAYYCDIDVDGYDNAIPSGSCEGYMCIPAGCTDVQGDDCNDGDASINPGATEVCDLIDNNCNGEIDEGVTITFYRDADGDMYGDAEVMAEACTQPTGFVLDNTDCDDTLATVNPGAVEVCGDGIDNNCNGEIDEGCGVQCISIAGVNPPLPADACCVVELISGALIFVDGANHGSYVSCVADQTRTFGITGKDRGQVIKSAAQSAVGMPQI